MTNRTRNVTALLAALITMPAIAAGLAPALDRDEAVERWASEVWQAARAGDSTLLERRLDALPRDAVGEESAVRFSTSLEKLRGFRTAASDSRDAQRLAALEEMRTELEANSYAKALRKAVEAQTYSDDLNSAFGDASIMEVVLWAEDHIADVERDLQWLEAQELLYLLRTFYEDTDRTIRFERFDEHLNMVNRRVGLIAQYVPSRLHEMRNERAIREGEEPFGEFNPATAVDWRERLQDIDQQMLRNAMQTAAVEHIETEGWRPLLQGGLDSLNLFATTAALSETFPSLGDASKVSRWVSALDRERESLAATADGDLDRWTLTEMLDRLTKANQETIDVDKAILFREFGDGALDRLDTYSEIIWPDKLRRFQQATAGNFVGVGILIRHNDKREIMVVNPLEGTPAYFQGVKPQDLIVEVNGDSTVGWSLNDAVDRITGPKGTEVTLGLRREGEEELVRIPMERDVIKIRSVKGWWKEDVAPNGEPIWDWYIDPVSRTAYIRLTQFTEDSFDDLRQAWREVKAAGNPSGLILDLRYNPGGLLTSAVQISNLFVADGSIVTGEDKDGNLAWGQTAQPNFAEFAGVPTVVLINRGSASASEIVAGSLQAHGAAVIVGERSFGKGSVQTIHHVDRDARLKLTTQYYRLPSRDGGRTPGRLVHKRPGAQIWGVDPDVTVPMTVKQSADSITLWQDADIIPLDEDGRLDPDDPERRDIKRRDINGLLTDGIDPQLATALLLLQSQALATDEVRHAGRGSPDS